MNDLYFLPKYLFRKTLDGEMAVQYSWRRERVEHFYRAAENMKSIVVHLNITGHRVY